MLQNQKITLDYKLRYILLAIPNMLTIINKENTQSIMLTILCSIANERDEIVFIPFLNK